MERVVVTVDIGQKHQGSVMNEVVGEKIVNPINSYDPNEYHKTKYKTELKYRFGYAVTTSLIFGAIGAIFVPVAGVTPALMFGITSSSVFVLGSAFGLFTMNTTIIDYGDGTDEVHYDEYDYNNDVGQGKESTEVVKEQEPLQSEQLKAMEQQINALKNSQLKLSTNQIKALEVLTNAYEKKQLEQPTYRAIER